MKVDASANTDVNEIETFSHNDSQSGEWRFAYMFTVIYIM